MVSSCCASRTIRPSEAQVSQVGLGLGLQLRCAVANVPRPWCCSAPEEVRGRRALPARGSGASPLVPLPALAHRDFRAVRAN